MSKNLAKIVKIFTFLCPHTYTWYIYVCSYTGVLSYHICVYNYVVGFSFLFFCVFQHFFWPIRFALLRISIFTSRGVSPGKITHRRKMYEIVHAYIHMRGYMYVVYIVCWIYKQLHTQQTYIQYIYVHIYTYSHIIQINN